VTDKPLLLLVCCIMGELFWQRQPRQHKSWDDGRSEVVTTGCRALRPWPPCGRASGS